MNSHEPRVVCRTVMEGVWKADHAVLCDVASGMWWCNEVLLGVVRVIPSAAGEMPCDPDQADAVAEILEMVASSGDG